jgi:F420-non-reducing hydrogenase iron-sulfur subunit
LSGKHPCNRLDCFSKHEGREEHEETTSFFVLFVMTEWVSRVLGKRPISGGPEPMALEFEPRIIAYCCNWCAYAGADLAGVSRLQYPPNIRVIRVMCSGRISPDFILKAFQLGADGVLVSGWHIGDCHYLDGNQKAQRMIDMTRELLSLMGIDNERLALEWVSSAEATRFAEMVTTFTQTVKELGKSPLGVAAWILTKP